MTLRILLVSVEAPPSFNPEAFQVGKVLEALCAEPDLLVDVVTAEPPSGVCRGLPAFLEKLPHASATQVVAIPCRFTRWQRALIRLFLPWLSNRPDWWFLFVWRWRQATYRLRQPPDLIYSRSFPPSSTLAAARLAAQYGVPWFLHLSDPWTESSIESERYGSRWHRRHERLCLEAAQRISFTSPTTLVRYQQRYPHLRDRMTLDPNCYDEANLQSVSWQPKQRFRIVHTGSFTLGRRPDLLIQAIQSLPADHPFLADLELIHAGPLDYHARRQFLKASTWLHNHGPVSLAAALELQRSADVLLAVDWEFNCSRDAQYLLSKLTDYLAIRRPVLAITDVDSASWLFVLENCLGTPVAHGDQAGLVTALLELWQAWRCHDIARFDLPAPNARYSAKAVAGRIAAAAREQLSPQKG